MIYLLNSPILTSYGTWRFEGPISVDHARKLLEKGFVSAIGHESSAKFLSLLLKLDIPANRIAAKMEAGDSALVLRVKERLPEGMLLNDAAFKDISWELSLLVREK